MAIGTAPLIPLHPVLANPEARFQRFGLNDAQLFGKPLVNLKTASRSAQAERTTLRKEAETVQPKGAIEGKTVLGAEAARKAASVSPELTPTYTGKAENLQGTATVPKPGSILNLKA